MRNQFLDVLLNTIALISRFSAHINDIVNVRVDIVLSLNMVFEGLLPGFELLSSKSTNIAFLMNLLLYLASLISHCCKSVNNDTEDEIK